MVATIQAEKDRRRSRYMDFDRHWNQLKRRLDAGRSTNMGIWQELLAALGKNRDSESERELFNRLFDLAQSDLNLLELESIVSAFPPENDDELNLIIGEMERGIASADIVWALTEAYYNSLAPPLNLRKKARP